MKNLNTNELNKLKMKYELLKMEYEELKQEKSFYLTFIIVENLLLITVMLVKQFI